MRKLVWKLLVKVLSKLRRGRRGHEPFGGAVFEVFEDNVDANGNAGPAEAMDEPGGHCNVADTTLTYGRRYRRHSFEISGGPAGPRREVQLDRGRILLLRGRSM